MEKIRARMDKLLRARNLIVAVDIPFYADLALVDKWHQTLPGFFHDLYPSPWNCKETEGKKEIDFMLKLSVGILDKRKVAIYLPLSIGLWGKAHELVSDPENRFPLKLINYNPREITAGNTQQQTENLAEDLQAIGQFLESAREYKRVGLTRG